jgi:hypothetical protein
VTGWMRHPDLPDHPAVPVAPSAFDGVWRHKGWLEAAPPPPPDDEPAPAPTPVPQTQRAARSRTPAAEKE